MRFQMHSSTSAPGGFPSPAAFHHGPSAGLSPVALFWPVPLYRHPRPRVNQAQSLFSEDRRPWRRAGREGLCSRLRALGREAPVCAARSVTSETVAGDFESGHSPSVARAPGRLRFPLTERLDQRLVRSPRPSRSLTAQALSSPWTFSPWAHRGGPGTQTLP